MTVERLSWASGPVVREGWHHSDERMWDGMDPAPVSVISREAQAAMWRDHLGPIQSGLPWADATFGYVVSHHGLMMLPEPDLIPALAELRRVTKPGGWLRVSVPDIGAAFDAWRAGYVEWFPLVAEDVDEAFCRYVTQGGATRSIFTEYRLARLLAKAGWAAVTEESYRSTMTTCRGITELDSRPDESIFMEARNGAAVSPAR